SRPCVRNLCREGCRGSWWLDRRGAHAALRRTGREEIATPCANQRTTRTIVRTKRPLGMIRFELIPGSEIADMRNMLATLTAALSPIAYPALYELQALLASGRKHIRIGDRAIAELKGLNDGN